MDKVIVWIAGVLFILTCLSACGSSTRILSVTYDTTKSHAVFFKRPRNCQDMSNVYIQVDTVLYKFPAYGNTLSITVREGVHSFWQRYGNYEQQRWINYSIKKTSWFKCTCWATPRNQELWETKTN